MIQLKNITRVFEIGEKPVYALKNINLNIKSGEYISIMGTSGSGKSTLLNMIGLLDRPTEGKYFFDNQDVSSLDDNALARIRLQKIGFIFQFFHLIPRLTAMQNVEMPLMLGGTPSFSRKDKVSAILKSVGLEKRMNHRPNQLSGGERQRVAISRAIVNEPSALLADEPTGNLDSQSGKEIIHILEDLYNKGITLIIVTHDPEIGKRAIRQIKMKDGEIISPDHEHL
jgi:putative ABC transport system ATP-binding protein